VVASPRNTGPTPAVNWITDHPEKDAWLTFVGILLLAAWIYFPGLRGAFLLDDYQNLKQLEAIQAPLSFQQLLAFVTSGTGDLGRYIALISFAPQYASWPADPWSFKLVNLLLHLLNGALLFLLLLAVTRLLRLSPSQRFAAALLSASLWLLHPLHVSTTLYVIQRMTELSALFTLAGLLGYVRGRELLLGHKVSGYVWASVGIALGGACAVMSKENGVLILLYALVLETTLFRHLPRPVWWRAWQTMFLYLPVGILAIYFAWHFQNGILPTYQLRDFTLAERLLTEARVLSDYLRTIFLPSSHSLGLFHDDYPVSHGLTDPPQTLAALFFVVGLLGAALLARSRAPLFAFGVLWFFAGHILESTVIPLEIYFEHRNYLPMAGILFAVVASVVQHWATLSRLTRYVAFFAGIVWLGYFSAITRAEASLWGNPVAQALAWSTERPHSLRAQERMGNVWAIIGNYSKAAQTFASMAEGDLKHAAGYLSWMRVGCYDADITLPDRDTVLAALRVSRFSNAPFGALEQLVILREDGKCGRLGQRNLVEVFNALLANPEIATRRADRLADLLVLLGRLHASERQLAPAMASLDQAYSILPSVETALLQVKLLASAGLLDDAQSYIIKARQANHASLAKKKRYAREIADWENALDQLRRNRSH
jgi:tetratricopeptide (TPR) repeat protein